MLTVLKRGLVFNITDQPDDDYLKYLRRRTGVEPHLRQHTGLLNVGQFSDSAIRLDISLDDDEGDVVAGLAAQTADGWLHIDMIWVEYALRGSGWGTRLIEMAEKIALERGCTCARVGTLYEADFFRKHGYVVTGKIALFPTGQTLTWMEKCLEGCDALPIPHHAG